MFFLLVFALSIPLCWLLTAAYYNPLINGLVPASVAIVITLYWAREPS
jgi:hypothetical protein